MSHRGGMADAPDSNSGPAMGAGSSPAGGTLLVYDFFAGTGSSTKAMEDAGHKVVRFDNDNQFDVDCTESILNLDASELVQTYGRPDFIWASPPCTSFSVASLSYHWGGGHRAYKPKTEAAVLGQRLVGHTLRLIAGLQPARGWLMENPRGVLRKLEVVKGIPRSTVTYCQYGDDRMKPTDIWGGIAGWLPNKRCSNGDNCHESAPRGSRTGTQGRSNAKERSRVPYGLSFDVCERLQYAPIV